MSDDKKNKKPKPVKPVKPEPDPVEEALSDLEDYLYGIPTGKAKGGLIRGKPNLAKKGWK